MIHESVLYASSDGVTGTDSAGRFLPLKHTLQKLHVINYVWDPVLLDYVVQQQGSAGGGGGGPVTIADGANVTQGAKADAAWDGAAAAPTAQAVLKYLGAKLEANRALLAGTLTVGLPAGAATSALQTTGNNSLASIDGKTPALGQALAAGSVPVVLTAAQLTTLTPPAAIAGFSLEATQALVKAKTDNLDVLLSTRLKPADTLAGVTTVAAVTAITNQLPAGTNKLGSVDIATAVATAKGTQGANGIPVQELKDAGRTRWSCSTVIAGVAGVAAEALLSMVVQRNSAPGVAATTQAVTAAKRLRLTSLTVGIVSTAAAVVSVRITLRCNPTAALVVASPIELIIAIPSGAALAQAGGFITIPLPDGFEYSGTEQFGLTHVGSVATYTLWASLNGYEY